MFKGVTRVSSYFKKLYLKNIYFGVIPQFIWPSFDCLMIFSNETTLYVAWIKLKMTDFEHKIKIETIPHLPARKHSIDHNQQLMHITQFFFERAAASFYSLFMHSTDYWISVSKDAIVKRLLNRNDETFIESRRKPYFGHGLGWKRTRIRQYYIWS